MQKGRENDAEKIRKTGSRIQRENGSITCRDIGQEKHGIVTVGGSDVISDSAVSERQSLLRLLAAKRCGLPAILAAKRFSLPVSTTYYQQLSLPSSSDTGAFVIMVSGSSHVTVDLVAVVALWRSNRAGVNAFMYEMHKNSWDD